MCVYIVVGKEKQHLSRLNHLPEPLRGYSGGWRKLRMWGPSFNSPLSSEPWRVCFFNEDSKLWVSYTQSHSNLLSFEP